jgi:hypothetical protein
MVVITSNEKVWRFGLVKPQRNKSAIQVSSPRFSAGYPRLPLVTRFKYLPAAPGARTNTESGAPIQGPMTQNLHVVALCSSPL